MNKRILLGIATLLAALLYACPADGGSTSGGSAPEPKLNIEEEIKQRNPALVYKADMNEDAQVLFSRGDVDNPYLFSLRVPSVKNIEAITGEITITGENKVLYEEMQGTVNPFEFNAHTDIKTYKTTEGMYVLDTSTFRAATSIDAVTDDPSYDGSTYIVGIGPAEDNPIDFDVLTDDFSVHVKILHEGEVLKEETAQVSKGNRYDITTWRDLQHVNDDLKGRYEVKNDIAFPSVGTYGYENFRPIGSKPEGVTTSKGLEHSFSGTFDGNNYKIEGLYIHYPSKDAIGLFGQVDYCAATGTCKSGIEIEVLPIKNGNPATIKNITVYHVGITGKSKVGGLIGELHTLPFTVGSSILENCHVYAIDGAKVLGTGSQVGGLIGGNGPSSRQGDVVAAIKSSSTHTDVEGKDSVGGLIGRTVFNDVYNSYATGNVKGTTNVGGLIGKTGRHIASVYANGNVTGEKNVGGLIGNVVYSNLIVIGYSTGNVTGKFNVGGVMGIAQLSGSNDWFGQNPGMRGYSVGNIVGEENVGGVIGFVSKSYATLVYENLPLHVIVGYARGQVRVTGKSNAVGLFIGRIEKNNSAGGRSAVVKGYISTKTSKVVGSQGTLEGINGNSITISEVNDTNYEEKFTDFSFGDEVGQWTWKGDGHWPAINIGGTSPVADQPTSSSS